MNVKSFIEQCQETYYNGMAIISDEEYDCLVKRFPQAEGSIGPTGDVPHLYRMYSLQKVYFDRGDEVPFKSLDQVETAKLDGCAISLLYIGGRLVQVLTRGDGIKGRDVTENAKLLNIPLSISQKVPTQITGEVTVTKPVENMRNYASGAMGLKDPKEFQNRIDEAELTFVAYGIQCEVGKVGCHGTYTEDMQWLENHGFISVLGTNRLSWFPSDGRVVRLNSNNEFNRLGWTNKFPRGAYAIKVDEQGEVTTLLEVTWDVGKSGKVTPVGHFEEIVIDDARITKATLNNIDYINALGLELGCQVRVIRSGGVIPKIVERVD